MQHKRSVAISSAALPAPVGPYSQAVLAMNGQMLFISGNFSLKPDIKEATHEIMGAIDSLLTAAGMEAHHVVKVTVYLTDMEHFAAMNEVYAGYFKNVAVLPARETVAVKALPKGAQIEISAAAVR